MCKGESENMRYKYSQNVWYSEPECVIDWLIKKDKSIAQSRDQLIERSIDWEIKIERSREIDLEIKRDRSREREKKIKRDWSRERDQEREIKKDWERSRQREIKRERSIERD